MLYDFDLSEAIDVINVLLSLQNFKYLNSQKFQCMKLQKLIDLCSKIYKKSLN